MGNVPIAFTDLCDVGIYVSRIISDPQTLNHMVFAYNEVLTFNQMYDLLERMSGEKLHCKYVGECYLRYTNADSADIIIARSRQRKVYKVKVASLTPELVVFIALAQFQCWSCGIRGDNSPENAQYLEYLLASDL